MLTAKQVLSILEGFKLPETVNAEEIAAVPSHPCPILRTSPYGDKRDPFMVGVYEATAALAIFLRKKKEDSYLTGVTIGDVATAAQYIEEGRMPLPWNRVSGDIVPDDPFSEGAVAALGALVLAMVDREELAVDSVQQKRAGNTPALAALQAQLDAEAGEPLPKPAQPIAASGQSALTPSVTGMGDLVSLTHLGFSVTMTKAQVSLDLDISDTLATAEKVLTQIFPNSVITRSEVGGKIKITVAP